MTTQVIQVEANSLEEARQRIRAQVPKGFFLVSEEVLSDGRNRRTARAFAKTADIAFSQAQSSIPAHSVLLEKKELIAPATYFITVEAFDEQSAADQAKFSQKSQVLRVLPPEVAAEEIVIIRAIKLLALGSKGFLGIRKKPNQYEVEVHRQSCVEITYKERAIVSARIGDRKFALEAVGDGNLQQVKDLLARGANVAAIDIEEETALHIAAAKGYTEIASLLIENGADVNKRNRKGHFSPLHKALWAGHPEIALLLIGKGADVNARMDNGNTPLHMATFRGYTMVAQRLIQQGADVNAKLTNESDLDATPLHIAATSGQSEIALLLLENGADVNARLGIAHQPGDGASPLHEAAGHSHTDTAVILLKYGAKLEARDAKGYTPLHWAVRRHDQVMIGKLLEFGADVRIVESAEHVTHGVLLLLVKNYTEAEAELRKAIELDPINVSAYADLGGAFDIQGQQEKAIPLLEKALELDPDLEGVPQALARAREALGTGQRYRGRVVLPSELLESPWQRHSQTLRTCKI